MGKSFAEGKLDNTSYGNPTLNTCRGNHNIVTIDEKYEHWHLLIVVTKLMRSKKITFEETENHKVLKRRTFSAWLLTEKMEAF